MGLRLSVEILKLLISILNDVEPLERCSSNEEEDEGVERDIR